MPKTVRIGQGTSAKDVVRLDLSETGTSEDLEMLTRWFKNIKSPDERRQEFSRLALGCLIDWGFPDPEEHYLRLDLYGEDGEDSVPHFLAAWLFEYRRLVKFREDVESGANPRSMPDLIECAASLGRLEGRFGFLNGCDPTTGKRWELLALSGQKQSKSGADGRKMRTDTSFAKVHGLRAQARADALFNEKPTRTWSWIVKKISEEFGVSIPTVKRALKNPKSKVGSPRLE